MGSYHFVLSHNAQTRIPDKIRSYLAVDIESRGGINLFDKEERKLNKKGVVLDAILNPAKWKSPDREKEEAFKPHQKGLPARRQIRNLIQTWKDLTKEEYLAQVYIPFVISKSNSASLLPTHSSKTSSTEESSCTTEDEPEEDEEVEALTAVSASTRTRAKAPTQTPPKAHTKPTTTNTMSIYDDDVPADANVIKVDVHHFENNREFRIYHCRDLPGKEQGTTYDGFIMVYRDVDIRDIVGTEEEPAKDDAFWARFVPPNRVVVGVPALNYGERGHDNKEVNDYIEEECIRKGMGNAINKFLKDLVRSRNLKTFDLQFPSDMKLSLENLRGANSKSGEMEYELLPVEVDIPELQENPLESVSVIVNGQRTQALKYVKFTKPALMWKIVIDEEGRDTTDPVKKMKPVSKGKAALLKAKKKRTKNTQQN